MSELRARDVSSTVAYDQIFTIESGQTLSNVIDVGGFKVCGIFVPDNFAGTQLRFKVGYSDINPANNLGVMRLDDGTDYTVTVAAADGGDNFSYVELPITKFAGVKYLAILATTTQGAEVNIVAALTLV